MLTRLSVLLLLVCVSASAAEGTRLVCIGDSITQGRKGKEGNKNAVPTYSWRYPLWKLCVDAGHTVDFVGTQKTGFEGSPSYEPYKGKEFDNENEGYWGWETKGVAGILKDKSTKWTADIAMIMLGTNDKEKEKTLEPTLNAMTEIVSILRKNNPKMVIAIGLPFQEWKPFPELSKAYTELAAKLNSADSPCFTVEHAKGWVSKPDAPNTHTVDWVHPNPSGDEKLAKEFFEAIKKYLK
jgi:lysophospholipase L1-like esterase